MSRMVVLLWLGASSVRPAFEADLEGWAQARRLSLESPSESISGSPEHDAQLAERLERGLEAARTATRALDEARALTLLGEVDSELRARPELPQSPWLMAERWRIEADLRSRSLADDARARRLRAWADAVEGARADVFVASSAADREGPKDAPTPTAMEPPALPTKKITLEGTATGDVVYVDGRRVSRSAAVTASEHHFRVLRRGQTLWAGWRRVDKDGVVSLPIPRSRACSRDDLGPVRIEDGRVIPRKGTSCGWWAVARPSASRGIEIATCRRDVCGALVEWRRGLGGVYEGPPQPAPEPTSPPWAAYALIGATIVAGATIAVWQSGVFDDPEPGRTRRVYQGPSLTGLSF